MMKKLNNKGFTLVEVIVVAVIVLVLAAVAIPLYNGYVEDSRLAAVENAAGAIASALGAAVQTNSTVTPAAPATVLGGNQIVIQSQNTGTANSQILVPNNMTANITATHVTVTHDKDPTKATATVQYTN